MLKNTEQSVSDFFSLFLQPKSIFNMKIKKGPLSNEGSRVQYLSIYIWILNIINRTFPFPTNSFSDWQPSGPISSQLFDEKLKIKTSELFDFDLTISESNQSLPLKLNKWQTSVSKYVLHFTVHYHFMV